MVVAQAFLDVFLVQVVVVQHAVAAPTGLAFGKLIMMGVRPPPCTLVGVFLVDDGQFKIGATTPFVLLWEWWVVAGVLVVVVVVVVGG